MLLLTNRPVDTLTHWSPSSLALALMMALADNGMLFLNAVVLTLVRGKIDRIRLDELLGDGADIGDESIE